MDFSSLFSSRQHVFIAVCLLLLLSFWAGGHVKKMQYDRYFDQITTRRVTNDPFPLVAPLVGTESPSAIQVERLTSIYKAVAGYGESHKDQVDEYSLYFRDLNSSQWFGINEDEGYIPASLLKIALAIAYLKEEESVPAFRHVDKTYTQKIANINTSVKYLEPSELKIGTVYTTDDLLNKMMIDSDNGAKDLLYSLLDKKYFYDLFGLMGIEQPTDASKYRLSAKNYAFFLRMLYNGTYLSAEDSERLLETMQKSTFTQGIVAGLPADMVVAHKYGTYTLTDDKGNKNGVELHDCGIVYDGDHPYILCVMTKGPDADQLASFISGISKTVYDADNSYFAH